MENIPKLEDSLIYKNSHWITYFLFLVCTVLDDPKSRDIITMEEARNLAEEKQVIEFLQENSPQIMAKEAIDEIPEVKESFNEWIWQIAGGVWGSEEKKLGIMNNGLCLIATYLTELAQQTIRSYR